MTPYYTVKGVTLYQGDCLKVIKELPKKSFDAIFADPPYFLSNGGVTCQAGKMVKVDKGSWDSSKGVETDFQFQLSWIKECRRILKPNGTIWISGTYHSIYSCGYALGMSGYRILNDICWFKPNASPNLSCRRFTASHETLIWAAKSEDSKFLFNYKKMKFGRWHEKDLIKKEDKQMRSVWSILTPRPNEKKYGKHPTQKPVDLLKRVILASTNKGDLVLDPFTGSSTTGIVAHKYGRRFVGIDIDKTFLDLSIRRFERK